MGFGILLIIAGVAALVAASVNKQLGGLRGLGIAGLALGILIFVAAQAFVSVPVGSVAIVVNRLTGFSCVEIKSFAPRRRNEFDNCRAVGNFF